MNKKNLAYIAGLFDGEGCISIYQKTDRSYHLGVELAMGFEYIPKWLRFAYGGYIGIAPAGKGGRKRPSYKWRLEDRAAESFIKSIVPYLIVKRAEAELALKFMQNRCSPSGYRRKTPEQKVLQEAQRILMKKMKQPPDGSVISKEWPDGIGESQDILHH